MKIEENVLLSSVTTFRTGGPARFLLTVASKEEIPDAVLFAEEKKLPLIPIGSGSNILAPDHGVNAVFVRLANDATHREDSGTHYSYIVEAGVLWDEFVARAVSDGAWGIENLSAIPGTVGAAVVQNIGAYGAALSDTVTGVVAFDVREKCFTEFSNAECGFGYRTSLFKKELDRYIITSVSFRLSRTSRPNLAYRDLEVRFRGETPELSRIRAAVIAIRAGKFPPLSEYGTAGSFFLNPTIQETELAAIKKQFPDMPLFLLPEGGIKVPLAWILDRALHLKGRREGKAFLWEQQPLVIATDAGASHNDVVRLARSVVQEVFEKTGLHIFPEVRILTTEKIS